jgi:hypothetical protein
VADLVSRHREGEVRRTAARRIVRAACLLALLLCAACQSSRGMGMSVETSGPGWGSFSGGRMFGAPL